MEQTLENDIENLANQNKEGQERIDKIDAFTE